MSKTLRFFSPDLSTELELPIVGMGISAGFPSPADDFIEGSIDLNKLLVKHSNSTFFARVQGHSMKNAGICDGDLLIIDKSLSPQDGKIAICQINGDFTVKRLKIDGGKILLVAENEDYEPIRVTEDDGLVIWGIVTYCIKKF